MPHADARSAAELILAQTTIPFAPQPVNLGPEEDMVLQCASALPCLKVDLGARRALALSHDREGELLRFYERLLAEDVDYFAPPTARGLDALLAGLPQKPCPRLLKGQVVGPVTFGTSVKDESGRAIIHDRELMDACCQGLAMKAAWQISQLRGAGAEAVIFFDEPSLAGFGSAFMALEREAVLGLFSSLLATTRQVRPDAVLGVHCCGNSDWPMLLSCGADVISFDSWSFLDNFCLFPREIDAFLRGGGYLAWGAVPTASPLPEDLSVLAQRLHQGLERLEQAGVNDGLLRCRSILTPSCGMGLLSEAEATRVLEALTWLRSEMLAARSKAA
ncbi:MAG: hypothetical protein V2A77_00095 [Pseudomonadota bacterium]